MAGANLCTYSKFRGTMNKWKNKDIADSPNTVAEVEAAFKDPDIMAKFGRCDGSPFYQGTVVEDAYAFTVFSSHTAVRTMTNLSGQKREFHIDATFGCLPQGEYMQLLVIHFYHDGHVSILSTNELQIVFCLH